MIGFMVLFALCSMAWLENVTRPRKTRLDPAWWEEHREDVRRAMGLVAERHAPPPACSETRDLHPVAGASCMKTKDPWMREFKHENPRCSLGKAQDDHFDGLNLVRCGPECDLGFPEHSTGGMVQTNEGSNEPRITPEVTK